MIKIGDKTYRNLEEQVQYLTNYHDVNQGLAQWGIRVVGQVESEAELPTPYDGEYGDAIAVGTEAPFSFYIWTRASIEGNPAYWFPFGEISIVGPQGPQGDKGDKGETGASTKWTTWPDKPTFAASEGDLVLVTATGGPEGGKKGDVYTYTGSVWRLATNILGPQGIQGIQGLRGEKGDRGEVGPQGPTGDPGAFIHIEGILTASAQLPTPESIDDLSIAYLVGTTDPYDLYIQIGSTSAEAIWHNTGPLNAATLVTSGGTAQNVWDADTKLDRYTNVTTYNQVYVKAADGSEGTINVTKQAIADAVVQRQSDGNILINTDPTKITTGAYVVNKNYVDDKASIKLIENTTGIEPKMYLYAKVDKTDQAKKIIAPGSIRIQSTSDNTSTDFTPSQIVNIVGENAKFFDYPAASGTLATLGDIAAAANLKFLRQEISASGSVTLLPNSLYMISVSGNNLNLVDGSTKLLPNSAQFMICFCADIGTAGTNKFAVMGMTYSGGININTFTIVATNGTTRIKNNNTSSTAGYNVMTKQ